MAKLIYIISALMLFQLCIKAAPNPDYSESTKSLSTDKLEEADPKLDNEPHEVGKDTNEEQSSQGQRHKRFYNYFSFAFSPYDTFSTQFVKRDQSQDTGVYGAEDLYSQIFKRVQDILYITKQQAFLSSYPRFPVLQQIPILYVPYPCGCTSDDNSRPTYDEEPGSDVTPAPDSITTTHPMINTSQPPSSAPPTDETSKTTQDLSNRFSESDDDDGARPISFEPIKPDNPLSRPPPPVDHGISQASENNFKDFEATPSTTIFPPSLSGVMAQPQLPTNSIPTLCDGAVLTCCHKPEPVNENCFESYGCPDTSHYDDPCGANVILTVIRKFQYYYANRRT